LEKDMLLLELRRVSGVCLLGGALAAGCGSASEDNPLAPGTSGSAAYLRAVVDGVSWSAAPSLIVATRDVAVGAVSLNGTEIGEAIRLGFGFPDSGPGTYSISGLVVAELVERSAPAQFRTWSANHLNGATGSVTVTSLTPTSATGTFEFTLMPFTSSDEQPGKE
jgi:hypothetical protein